MSRDTWVKTFFSPVTRGDTVLNPKDCHLLFEWPLTYVYQRQNTISLQILKWSSLTDCQFINFEIGFFGKCKTIAGAPSQFYHLIYIIEVLSSQLYHRIFIIPILSSQLSSHI